MATAFFREPDSSPPSALDRESLWDATTLRSAMLIEFYGGPAESIEFSLVLQHLRRLRPDWDVDVVASLGRRPPYAGLCRRTFSRERDPQPDRGRYAEITSVEWSRAYRERRPGETPARCTLRELLDLETLDDLGRCVACVSPAARANAAAFLEAAGLVRSEASQRFPAVAIHYHHDETGRGLAPETARLLAEAAIRSGRTPVLLSWNRRPPVADASDFEAEILGSVAWRGWGLGDAETLAALIDSVELMVGIDAAPLRFAMATDTPTIAVWTGESPWSAIEPSPNVEHWLPHAGAHEALAPAVRRTVAARHAHRLYRELEIELPTEIEHRLTGRAGAVAVSHAVRERRRGRREFAAAGPERFRELQGWEDFGRALDYGRWIVPALALAGRRVLDVGAGCGAIVQAFGRAGAVVQGVECQEAWVERGQARWPDMAPLLHAADPTNLPFFADASWDAIHAGQFTDPLPFALVPAVLAEFRRLVVDGGRLFLRVDVRDGRAASGVRSSAARPAPNDVPTLAWWREQLKAAGWEDVSSDWSSRLVSAPLSFLSQYDWNWFVARRATQLSGEPS